MTQLNNSINLKLFILLLLNLLFYPMRGNANSLPSSLYLKTYGNPQNPPIIFIHGGPGYNSWDFELTTSSHLSAQGYFVVVYDQRGQGRSGTSHPSQYNYHKYASDLLTIIHQLHLTHPILMGHSHGGAIAIKFDSLYPGIAQKIVLLAAPLNFVSTLEAIHENCLKYYIAHHAPTEFAQIEELQEIIKHHQHQQDLTFEQQLSLVGNTFMHAVNCHLYEPKSPTFQSRLLRKELLDHPLPPSPGDREALPAFMKNENFLGNFLSSWVLNHSDHYCGVYGEEDGLFNLTELRNIHHILDKNQTQHNFKIIKNASHFLYIDQREEFLNSLSTICNLK